MQDRCSVGGELRPDLALDLLQRVVGMGAGRVKNTPSTRCRARLRLQRLNGVAEGRRLGLRRDRRDLGVVLGEGALEGRQEVLGRNAAERRHVERAGPGLEEGIVVGGGLLSVAACASINLNIFIGAIVPTGKSANRVSNRLHRRRGQACPPGRSP